jgi:hypothetical protein
MKILFRLLIIFITASLICSCGDQYYLAEDFLTVKKIDTHVHLNGESTALTKQAQNDNFSLLTINVDAPHYPDLIEQQRIALLQIEHAPQHVQYLTAFSLSGWDSAAWSDKTILKLKSDFAKGALGVKLWKNIGMVYKDSTGNFIMIDNPWFDPVINFIIAEDKTVLGHLGEPKNCWLPLEQMTVNNDRTYFSNHPEYHMYLHPEYPSYEEQIAARDQFLKRHPDMRFVGAHLGSLEWDVDELAKRLDKFPNMAVDMAARIPHLQHQSILEYDKVRNFLIEYQDRIIYATDAGLSTSSDPEIVKKQLHETWMEDWKYFVTDETMTSPHVNGNFKGLKLPKKVVDKIYRANAIHWFKIPQ